MNNKYYIPQLEEFFVGFKFEEYWNDKPQIQPKGYWKQRIFNRPETISSLNFRINRGDFRVKYLDSSDIESEGFEYSRGQSNDNLNKHYKCKSKNLWYNAETNQMLIENSHGIMFRGTIKNINEFRKIIKMLNIKK